MKTVPMTYIPLLTAVALFHALRIGKANDDINVPTSDDQDSQDKEPIVGGEEVKEGRYPYQVALMRPRDTFLGNLFCGGLQFCAGTLVDKDWVLSAAHCQGQASVVQIGRHDLSKRCEDFEEIEIDWETTHPDFNNMTINNDFMMVKLKKSSKYSPVTLDYGSVDLADGIDVTAIGWGHTSYEGKKSSVLLEVETDVIDNIKCSEYWSLTENMICSSREGKSTCHGDSGGPLIIKGTSANDDIQVGIVSYGSECGKNPAVYSKVASKFDWINEQIHSGRSGTRPANRLLTHLRRIASPIGGGNK